MAAKPAVDNDTLIELGKLSLQLAGNPKTRKAYLKQVQEVNPTFVLPPDIATQELSATIDQRFAERDTQERTKEVKTKLERERKGLLDGTLLAGRKFSEDDVKKIDEFMTENGYTNYEHAAVIYGAQQEPAQGAHDLPPTPAWEMPKIKNPFDTTAVNANARAKAFEAIRELRQGAR